MKVFLCIALLLSAIIMIGYGLVMVLLMADAYGVFDKEEDKEEESEAEDYDFSGWYK